MSNNKRTAANGGHAMADNILVMDVEGTDGRERGEDQDFERKSALFALATSEVLIVNMWEHQVGLFQGANMGLLKTVFEVNLQLFLKDAQSVPRSLLYFVIRDHLGTTPLSNLRETILQDLARIWVGLSKPPGLEDSKIDDYFDFAFVALPHKVLQPEKFVAEVHKLGQRFRQGQRDPKRAALSLDGDDSGVLLTEYHRRIPADGFPMYAAGIWEQIVDNKDLDLPTQQELLAQFRCDEIAREALVGFDEQIKPLENRQADGVKSGKLVLLAELGAILGPSRVSVLKNFQTEASRYHKAVYQRKLEELREIVDGRLKALFVGQLNAQHKLGVQRFSDNVSEAVRLAQKKGANYDFAQIVAGEKKLAISTYQKEAAGLAVEGASWSDYEQELGLYRQDLDEVSSRLRRDEMRRLATRVERYVKQRLAERIGLEFNSLGSGRAGQGAPAEGEKPASEKDLWDRVWQAFCETVGHASARFTDRAAGFDASPDEVAVGLWRLKRKSWSALRAKLDDEVMEGNILLKLRENFEDKFRYDEAGVPRIWRPTDDIEGAYTTARHSTLTLIPLLARFRLAASHEPPPLEDFLGSPPASVTAADEDDLLPIGGVDDDAGTTIEEEMTILADAKAADLATRFKKAADGVYVEAKRSAIGGVAQVPLYFYGLLLALGWNELWAVLRNPLYFVMLILLAAGAYVTYTLNLWGPMLRMANAASAQGLEVGKERLREFLEVRQGSAAAATGRDDGGGARRRARPAGEEIELDDLGTAKDDEI